MTLAIVSECCPVGCGVEVILLCGVDSTHVFAYCDLCGCVWRNASEARLASVVNAILALPALAPQGVVIPTPAQIETAGWASAVIRTISSSTWVTSIDELNRAIRNGTDGVESAKP